jgi:hypothetical protein
MFLTFALPSCVSAAQFHSGDYTLDKESVIDDDLYVSGDNVNISGIVDGDAFIGGSDVKVDGTVTGDLYIFGNLVKVTGNVYGNIISGGNDVVIEGTVGQNLFIGASKADISANIAKDLMVGSWMTNLSGTVGDDVRIGSSNVTSDAIVGGDFILGSETNNVDEKDVAGELVIQAPKDINVQEPTRGIKPIVEGFSLTMTIVGFLGMLIVGALMIYLAPVKTLQFERKINGSWNDFIKSFGIGLLVLFGVPLPLLVLMFTFVGTPLALLISGVLIFLVSFGTIWAEIAIGNKVLSLMGKEDNQRYLSLVVGRLITVIVKIVPIVRGFYSLVLACVTVGAVIRSKTEALSRK